MAEGPERRETAHPCLEHHILFLTGVVSEMPHREVLLVAFRLKGIEEDMTLKERYEFVFESVGPVCNL